MKLMNKIGRKTKAGLAVLVGGAILGLGGMANAKEINEEGWPLPDQTEEYKWYGHYHSTLSGEYQGKQIEAKIVVEMYITEDGKKFCEKLKLLDGTPFLYSVEETQSIGYVLFDRDGNGTFETKYLIPGDEDEIQKDGLPEWVFKKLLEK